MLAGTRRTARAQSWGSAAVSRRRPAAGPSRGEEVEAVRRKRDAHHEGRAVESKVCEDFLDAIGAWWFRIRQQQAERAAIKISFSSREELISKTELSTKHEPRIPRIYGKGAA
jgi:hypothetical protein